VVLSSRPIDFSAVRGGVVEQMTGAPVDIASKTGGDLCPLAYDRRSTAFHEIDHRFISVPDWCITQRPAA